MLYLGWTHSFTDLLWDNYQVSASGFGVYSYGWLYILLWLYFYICLFVAVLIFVTYMRYRGSFYQDQIKLILTSAIISAITVAISIIWPTAALLNQILPISFSISGLLVGFGIYKYRLFDLSTITYHNLLENFRDGLIIFDQKLRLIFANLTAEQLLNIDSKKRIGRHITQIVSEDSVWFSVLAEGSVEAIVHSESHEIHYEIEQVFLPHEENKWKQKLIIIRDVTPAYMSLNKQERKPKPLLKTALWNWMSSELSRKN